MTTREEIIILKQILRQPTLNEAVTHEKSKALKRLAEIRRELERKLNTWKEPVEYVVH